MALYVQMQKGNAPVVSAFVQAQIEKAGKVWDIMLLDNGAGRHHSSCQMPVLGLLVLLLEV